MSSPHISIVSSLYKSENFIEQFLGECTAALEKIECTDYEIILVNDGSPDRSVEKVLSLKKQYDHLKLIDLSRNFGHHYAFWAGMKYSTGTYVFNIDCDLEVSPFLLAEFYPAIKESSFDVVYGYQEIRKGGVAEKYLGGMFWKIMSFMSEVKIPENIITERLMSRRYVEELLKLGDKNIFLAGLMYWTGFEQKGIAVTKKRRKGKSTYSFFKRYQLITEAISSFSSYPLKLLFRLGSLLTIISFVGGMVLIVRKLIFPSEIMIGYTSVIVAIVFLTGIIVSSLGIIGLYIDKIFNQVKNRPNYIIKNIYE